MTETTEQRRRRTHKRTGLVLDEVSLVDKGACPGARVALAKRDTSGDTSTTTSATKRAEMHRRMDAVQAQINALVTSAETMRKDSTMTPHERIAKQFEDGRIAKAEDAHGALNDLARERAEKQGETHAQAYSAVLKTELGRTLFDAYDRFKASETAPQPVAPLA